MSLSYNHKKGWQYNIDSKLYSTHFSPCKNVIRRYRITSAKTYRGILWRKSIHSSVIMGFPSSLTYTLPKWQKWLLPSLLTKARGGFFLLPFSLLPCHIQGFLNIPNSLLHNICKLTLCQNGYMAWWTKRFLLYTVFQGWNVIPSRTHTHMELPCQNFLPHQEVS